MHCLSAEEVTARFGSAGFSVSDEHRWYRRALVLNAKLAGRQTRLSACAPDAPHLPDFLLAVNAWLPASSGRLLWVDHWQDGVYHDGAALLVAARHGIGESRSLEEAPGHYFEAHAYEEEDQSNWTSAQRVEAGLLAGLMSLLILEKSDGWLIADQGVDRFEVWEGNVLFHSADRSKIEKARALLREYECGTMK